MNFLAPWVGGIAAAATVPLLVLLYFLKLKRRQVSISSTLLWKRVVQDLQVNAPFQWIRYSILLLLQLLILASVLLALSRPVLTMQSGPPKRFVLLIDRSASMNAMEAGKTRLDLAKERAKELVNNLRSRMSLSLQEGSDEAMVVAFDERAKVMCNFTSDRRQLLAAIDGVTPTDGVSSLAEAVTVAKAFAQSPGDVANGRSSIVEAQLELFSDGRIADASQILVGDKELNFHRIGAATDNVAITAMQARRVYEKPADVEVFASLANYSDKSVTCDVQLSLDGNIVSVQSVEVPARRPAEGGKPAGPGSRSLKFNFVHSRAGIVEVKQLRPDALASDDVAFAVLPAPKSLSVLLVTEGNVALESALKNCSLAKLEVATPTKFDEDAPSLNANPLYDLIVLDKHAPEKLPRGRFIVFGVPPPGSGARVTGELQNQMIVDWRSRHPVLQYVNLSNLFVSKARKISVPSDAAVLAEFASSPALALIRREQGLFLLVPFDCMDTNWPFEASFVMFFYNATGFLGMELSQEVQSLKVHQAISMENLVEGAKVNVSGPGIKDEQIAADPSGAARFGGTNLVGVYGLEAPSRPKSSFAVNLLDAQESNIEPLKSIVLAGQTVEGQDAITPGQMEIWPYLALVALVLACVEWLLYNYRIRIR